MLFRDSREFCSQGAEFDKLFDLIKKTGADTYISGPAPKLILMKSAFNKKASTLSGKNILDIPNILNNFRHSSMP